MLHFRVFAKLQSRLAPQAALPHTFSFCVPFIQPLCFQAFTHSLAPRTTRIFFSFNYFRTLFIATGGVGGAAFFRRSDVQTWRCFNAVLNYPLSFHTLAHSFALFCTLAKRNSFVFNQFCTLRQKTDRRDGRIQRSLHPSAFEPALPPMVKCRSPLRIALANFGVRRLATAFFRLAADNFCRGAAPLRPSLARC